MNRRPCGAYAVCLASRWWLLWLLPLMRWLLSSASPSLVLRDTLLAAALTVYGVLQWRCCRYRLRESDDGRFHSVAVQRGIVLRRSLHVCAEDAASVEVERTPLLWLLRARRIRISTAGLRRRTDAVLYLAASHTRRLFFLPSRGTSPRNIRLWPVVLLSLSGSNALVGVLTLVPLLRAASRLLGKSTSEHLLAAGDSLWVGVPPLLSYLANLLLLGWGVAVVSAFFRYMGFRVKREEGHLHITSGFLTRRDVLIDGDRITALEQRQTLLMRLWGFSSAIITAAGYGRDARSRPVLIPAADAAQLKKAVSALLPDYPTACVSVHPRSRLRYAAAPLAFLTVGSVGALLGEMGVPITAAWMVAGVWWLLIRLLGFESAGFGMNEDGIIVCYPRGLALYRVQLPREVADRITVTQTLFQRVRGTCTVQVYCFGEKRRRHRVFGLPSQAVQRLLHQEKFNENLT